jgi:uncharacterized protein
MTKASTSGRFVWHDLMTTDAKAAIAFYTELLGWKTTEVEMGPMGKYTMIKAGDRDIGGIMTLDKKHGVPSHWLGYTTTDDVDAAAKRAVELGGKVEVPGTDIPNVGRFAILSDPQGGHFSAFKGKQESPEPEGPLPAGTFCWDELLTSDPAAAVTFYKAIFGYTTDTMDMGPMGTYHLLKRAGKDAGGVMKQPMPEAGVAWLTYIAVDDVDASTTRAQGLKAKLLAGPDNIPNIGRFSVVQDPTGAAFALFKGAAK